MTPAGLIPLSLRFTIAGVRGELAPGISCPESYWSKLTHQLIMPASKKDWVLPEFSPEAVEQFNDELYQFKREIRELYKRMRRPDPRGPLVEVTAADLHCAVRGDGPETAKTKAKAAALRRPLLDMARQFVDALQDVPKADRLADSTLQNYESRLNTLKRYLACQGTKTLPAAEVDIPWCRRYERWLLTSEGGFGSTAMRKQVNFVQLALSFAVHEGWLPVDKLRGYKYQTRATTPPALSLTAAEVAKLVAVLPDLYEAEQRAVTGWLFCAYTGLSWVDYGHFCHAPGNYLFTEPAQASGDRPTYWLRMVRQKMKRRKPQGFSVPLFDEAAELLVKWQGRLPFSNDVNVNKLLHRVEEELGLSQSMTTKLARATFSQLKRDAGYSDEAVAAMMGDSVSVMNRHYSRISERRIALEMGRLAGGHSMHLAA
ncbi:tyrosine-type recombinase/integrase [Hymenobacter baengnokdamensis]|uniref:tyrosine-type recombinase/integrase n=1 Tax=Hymenobacter baengnokdamensis TaxID=2615203 RepID=UPI001245D02F|nr:phage integrase SAM-like domain-containing protein [Hymenobacter baengnokdamensis]